MGGDAEDWRPRELECWEARTSDEVLQLSLGSPVSPPLKFHLQDQQRICILATLVLGRTRGVGPLSCSPLPGVTSSKEVLAENLQLSNRISKLKGMSQ